MASKRHKIFRVIWVAIVLTFMIWQCQSYQAQNIPDETFSIKENVDVKEDSEKISFISLNDSTETEVIFFQGGLVDPEAYAPLCRELAESGYSCHIVKMDFRMPLWGYDEIKQLFNLNSVNYVLGGHSQGGKMAAKFVQENPDLMKGLILLGTSHPRDFDMSNQSIPTLKLYAEFDGLASVTEVLENESKLPENASLVMIEGGNHSQFGYMGHLLMDSSPSISLQKQQTLILENLTQFLMSLDN